jgi:hypothetical protein
MCDGQTNAFPSRSEIVLMRLLELNDGVWCRRRIRGHLRRHPGSGKKLGMAIPDPRKFSRSRFEPSNTLSFESPWDDLEIDWWEENLFQPHGIYPDDLGEMLSASAKEPKAFMLSNLDTRNNSFVIKVTGLPSESGEIWWHQRKLDLKGRIFEAQRMAIPFKSQARGKGRLLMADLVETASSLGIRQIEIEAQEIGRYAWARFGFVPDRGSWKFQVALEARRRLQRARSQLDPQRYAYFSDILDTEDPAMIREVASWRDKVDSTEFDDSGLPLKVELGKALLLETSAQWFGVFDLGDNATMSTYHSYLKEISND